MISPKTIEELLKRPKAYPFSDGEIITEEMWDLAVKYNRLPDSCLISGIKALVGVRWIMPDDGFYLPPDKQLGLPLGQWLYTEIKPLIDILPFGTIKAYCLRYGVARFMRENGEYIKISDLIADYGSGGKTYYIIKQPYGYYNPITPDAAEENPPIKPTMVKDANGKEWACFTLK